MDEQMAEYVEYIIKIGAILLGIAVLVSLVWILARWFVLMLIRKKNEKEERRLTIEDRELLDLISDLAEIYRSTGR